MAELPETSRRSSNVSSGDISIEISGDDSNATNSSGCSTDVPVDFDIEIVGEDDSSSEASGVTDRSSAGQNMHSETSTSAIDTGSKLPKSRGRRHGSKLALYAARFLDEKVPFRKKIKFLNQVANVKHDGTVQFDVPIDMKPHALDFGSPVVYDEVPEKEHINSADVPELPPPLQIVMLIVGTRGDVQPFVAIGKRLQ
ncbi:UDP-glucuronosyl/UDP-glucosyltransferase, partial [Corchorus capsularis]